MPATVADPTGALSLFVHANNDYELVGMCAVFGEYRERVVKTVGGSTYWRDVVLAGTGLTHSDSRPSSMFRTPGFSVREAGGFEHAHFEPFDDPDDLVW